MRLDKYLANNTDLSRKQVRVAIKKGRVELENELAEDPSAHISPEVCVKLDGEPVVELGLGYFMMNKAEGWICSHGNEQYPSVYECFDRPAESLHVAGRLDVDTTGLLLVTGDGQWSHRISSPAHHCPKVYRVWLAEFITERMISKLEKGVFLEVEGIRTKPAKVDKVDEDEVLLTITEGKYHQVKRMMEAVGNSVDRLHREQIGDLQLDESLLPGEWRELREDEVGLF
jgi:16S rRNA pseudouridine516 synthase